MKTKKRSANFTERELRLLMHLAKANIEIIDHKKNDSIMWKLKNKTWEKISRRFNSCSGTLPRTAEGLRKKWDTVKKLSSEHTINNEQSSLAALKTEDEKILASMQVETVVDIVPTVKWEGSDPLNTPDESSDTDWSTYPPAMLTTEISTELNQSSKMNKESSDRSLNEDDMSCMRKRKLDANIKLIELMQRKVEAEIEVELLKKMKLKLEIKEILDKKEPLDIRTSNGD